MRMQIDLPEIPECKNGAADVARIHSKRISALQLKVNDTRIFIIEYNYNRLF